MNDLKQQKVIFTGTKIFHGSIEDQEHEAVKKEYRFKIILNERQKLIAIPEVYIPKSNRWKKTCPGWLLDDVMDSKGLFLDFGQKKYIMPTISVWNEIRNALNQYDLKRP